MTDINTLRALLDLLDRTSDDTTKPEPETDSLAPGVSDYVIVRTVTMIYTGELVDYDDKVIELYNAAWIADTGRWSNALATGVLSEVEPYPENQSVYIERSSVVDWTVWSHDLPRGVK